MNVGSANGLAWNGGSLAKPNDALDTENPLNT